MNDKKADANALPSSTAFELSSPHLSFDEACDKSEQGKSARRDSGSYERQSQVGSDADNDLSYAKMGWRGLTDSDHGVDVTQRKRLPEADLDMTSMVDVTFLLLIFFMITASFTLQRSIEQPKARDAQVGPVVELESVEVKIDANNIFYVSVGGSDEVECPSESEMRSQVKASLASVPSQQMVLTAHPDSSHQTVILAWDAGVVSGASQIKIKTSSELD